ncbi:MAG: S8 family serine peptidase [Candidatus Schekmanbacteria bacterium]|nr:S8 family serine peptidase [Candidatus Schekmanbacteria bacterium]
MKNPFARLLSGCAVALAVAAAPLAAQPTPDAAALSRQLRQHPQIFAHPPFVPGSLIVRLQNPAATAAAHTLLASHHHARKITALGAPARAILRVDLELSAPSARDAVSRTLDAYAQLAADPAFAGVDLNWKLTSSYLPDDPYAIDDGHPEDSHADQYFLRPMNVPDAWDLLLPAGAAARSATVAVLDSGVALSHPDLHRAVVDGGYDFASGDADPATDTPGDPANGDGADNNRDGYADAGVAHGTHVAGLIAAELDNGLGVAGLGANRAGVLPVRVMDDEGSGELAWIVDGIFYAANKNVDVISMSLGMPQKLLCTIDVPAPDAMIEAVRYAYERGVIVVAATGNAAKADRSCGVSYPAALDHVIAVGSSNLQGERSKYSDYGGDHAQVDVTAFGGDFVGAGPRLELTEVIWSTWVIDAATAAASDGKYEAGQHVYGGAIGTSMAAPEVAALAALVRSVRPELAPDDVASLITGGARDLLAPGWDVETGAGQVDFLTTLAAASATVGAR